MSDTQEEQPVSVWARVIGGGAVLAALVAVGTGWGIAQHNAQVQADASHAMTIAAPAYAGASTLDGNLVALNTQSVQAKQAYDTEQARIAAEQAAQAAAAAAQAAAAAAAQAAADQAAADQAAQQQTASQQQSVSSQSAPSQDSGPAPATSANGLPAGSPVPWIPSTDPNNSAGGSWDTQACASHNASGSPAVCD